MRQLTERQLRDREALMACDGNVTRAAKALGITNKALHQRLLASAQVEWWIKERKKFRENRKQALLRRKYARKKERDAQKAAQAYLAYISSLPPPTQDDDVDVVG